MNLDLSRLNSIIVSAIPCAIAPAAPSKPAHRRSDQWPSTRAAHLKAHPFCAATGLMTELEVHHIIPFAWDPELELDPDNLITLTEHASFNAHFWLGHLGDWRSRNPDVVTDAVRMLEKIRKRGYPPLTMVPKKGLP